MNTGHLILSSPDTFICLPKSPCNLPHFCQLLKTTAVRNIHHDHITTRQNEEPMISCQDLRDIFGHLYPMGLACTRWAARKTTNGCWTWNLHEKSIHWKKWCTWLYLYIEYIYMYIIHIYIYTSILDILDSTPPPRMPVTTRMTWHF